MPYSFATLAQAQSDLVQRLYDPQGQFGAGTFFWTQAELIAYIQEAIRTWNALTNYFRSEFTFPLAQGVNWYDITNTTTAPQTTRPFTVTDNIITQMIELCLLEPLTTVYPLVWGGSNQFNIQQILTALSTTRNEILGRTGCHVTQSVVNDPVGRVFLADTTIDIRRVAWIPATGLGFTTSPLFPGDIQGEQNFDPLWTTKPQQQPTSYFTSTEPQLSFDVNRTSPVAAQFEILSVLGGANFTTAASSLLGIPDDWSWVIKWGALADLLASAHSPDDPIRSAYCARRYEESMQYMLNGSSILGLRVNNVPLPVDAVRDADEFNTLWEGKAQAAPQNAYIAGWNLLGFPPPDAGPYSITVNAVANAPVPVLQGDFLQISREDYDTVLDYAQHLASFKLGGSVFQSSIPLYQHFLQKATQYNAKLAEMGLFQKPIFEIGRLQDIRNPRMVLDTSAAGGQINPSV